ncbi:aminotransferase class I/II-fold pyridoxal phosphate-dependent enzyme [Paracoccus onubensis]|uniref:pyridoxal phosphate-dependent aminotransferase n=1 Tax=Paracoccus onubensis TaxID=1675788 RepID=UPI002731B811|nr:aminotransferase class I/II-fold pyridoxal phosphate-dependent enzyme [Paracoccus onubensis]MDP0929139.1 aminotransferase class I/II-fold pyridoxal phosphate-dependent enzyme [Paracoccus onubensis]
MRQSARGQVEPFIVMDVMEAAAQAEASGRHTIHMEVGQPGTPAPAGARKALAAALEQPLGYTVALGLPALRQGIADLYRRWYGIQLDPARVIVTPGSSGAFILAFSALFDAGDRVAMGFPGYPSYRQILRAMSLEPVGIETRSEDRYQPRPEALPDAQGLILASPGNPSGTVLRPGELQALTQAAAAREMAVISDEIYHGLSYGDRCHTALEITDDVFVINSFSKFFSMTGWRIGWMIVPETHLRTVERLAQNMFICPPHASQVAALAALDCEDEARANLAVYAENRRLMLEGLPKAGFTRIAPPEGAFYIYADISDITDNSLEFAKEVLDRAGVAVTPGLDFDPDRGARSLRFSYARATSDIAEGLRRLAEFMASR